jgi:short-subunit dehydrogenase
MSYWRGKRAVVTGGSSGLGRAMATVLVRRGAKVAIVARRQEPLEATAQELKGLGGEVLSIVADVTKQDDVDRLGSIVQSTWGGLDLLCHSAGRSMRGTVTSTAVAEFQEVIETNFLSAVRCTQAFASALVRSRGHLVFIGSLASKVASGYLGAYPASKFLSGANCAR